MPALTAKAIVKHLSGYVRSDEDIIAKLNLIMPRIYSMGMWRDLMFDHQISTTNDFFSLPDGAESLLGALLDDAPVEYQSRWHDYRISGYATEGVQPVYGVVDDGWHTLRDTLVSGDTYNGSIVPTGYNTVLPSEGLVRIELTQNGVLSMGEYELDGSASIPVFTDLDGEVVVTEITFFGVHQTVALEAISSTTTENDRTLAYLLGDGVSRYRWFRFSNPLNQTRDIKLLLKRSWTPIMTDNDIVYLGNLNAIKHGLLGMLAEDKADVERANYHWTICRQILDEELDAARGAIKPKVKLRPAGINQQIYNIY